MPDKHFQLWIRVYGGMQIERGGKLLDLEKFGGSKPLELLKFLIAYGGRNVSVDFAATKLWPSSEGDNARGAFNGTLLRLRKIIGVPDALILKSGMISLNSKVCWLDTWAFDNLSQEIARELQLASVTPDQAGIYMGNLLAIFRGPCFMSESDLPWVYVMQDKTKSKFCRTVLGLGQFLAAHEKYSDAAMLYERALEYYPLSEELCLKLMEARIAQGLTTESILAFRRFEHMLRETMGMQPSEVLIQKMKSLKGQQ